MNRRSKVLIVGPSWVGDMVMAHSLYRFLRQRTPSLEIHVLAPTWSLPLLERMPEVSAAHELPLGHGEIGLGIRRAVAAKLKLERFDRAIVLPRSLKAALVPFFAGIPVRTGFRGEWRYGLINDMRRFDVARLDQTVLRFLALGLDRNDDAPPERPPEPTLAVNEGARAAVLERLGLESTAVALMPGAEYGEAKRWPVERFADLAARLGAAGHPVWVLGSAKEHALGEALVSGAGAAGAERVRNLCGETTLTEAVDLLATARVAVSNDSGLMHVAAAVGTHVVAIYGSSSPLFTPPLTPKKTILYAGLSCSPCFARECPLHHLNCLRAIDVNAVHSATLAALSSAAVEVPPVSTTSGAGKP